MQQWQYTRHTASSLSPSDWATLGEDRWELVCIVDGVAHFKRPILNSAVYAGSEDV